MKIKWSKKWFSKLTITEGRKPYHGVNGIFTHYGIRCDPYLGLGIFEMRIIPCACISFINDIDLSWDLYPVTKYHPRYSSVTKYKYYPILGQQNDF